MAWGRKNRRRTSPGGTKTTITSSCRRAQSADRAGRRAVAETVSTMSLQRESSNNVP